MTMSNLHLLDTKDWGLEPIRKGFGRGLADAGAKNEQIVALCADLTSSTQISLFAEQFPERFVEVGIAEQNLVTVASGMAAMGKIPFTASYAAFSPGRNWEQIKTTVALNNQNVKIIGAHAGLYTGPDGATHQMLEDVAIMRVMPNMVVIVPGDSLEAYKATLAIANDPRPTYLRLARDKSPIMTTDQTPFEIGKAYIYTPGHDLTIIANGTVTSLAVQAAESLFKDAIDAEVIHSPTVKPLDEETIYKSVKKTRAVVVVEEAQRAGGLGGAVSEFLSENLPVPVVRVGVRDQYGQSGTPEQLIHHYGLSKHHIMMAAHHAVDMKK